MQRRRLVLGTIAASLLVAAGKPGRRRTLKAAVTVRAADSLDRFRRLLTVLASQCPEFTIDIAQMPLPQALEALDAGTIDLILPFAAPLDGQSTDLRLSRSSIMKGYQILYTNRAAPIEPKSVAGRRIEVDPGMAATFAFPTLPSASPDESIARLSAGAIDGYINAEGVADAALKRLGFTNIHRELFRVIEGHAVIAPGPRGDETDAFLSRAVERARDEPDFRMMQERTYGEWQPYQ